MQQLPAFKVVYSIYFVFFFHTLSFVTLHASEMAKQHIVFGSICMCVCVSLISTQ